MDDEPVTAKSLSWTYMINANTFERAYKDTLSGFSTWDQKEQVTRGQVPVTLHAPSHYTDAISISKTGTCPPVT